MTLIPPKIKDDDFGPALTGQINPELCQKIIDLQHKSTCPRMASRIQRSKTNVVDITYRDVDMWVVGYEENWVDELVIEAARDVNQQFFDFDCAGLVERPQLLRYSAPSNGYDWHLDIGSGDHSTRKISITILLNEEFDGGELCFFTNREHMFELSLGHILCFPSFMSHRVRPVDSGERWALVAWISGSPFR